MKNLYEMIFKRKSIRKFDKDLKVSDEELKNIQQELTEIQPLIKDIQVKYKIVRREETTCKKGEYCLLLYSEKKDNYLLNTGYLLQQMDFWMAENNIGVCWHGIGKPRELECEGLSYVIMLNFGKSKLEDFRKDYTKAKRKDLETIWEGESYKEIGGIARYAPSACNSQPWRIHTADQCVQVYRTTKVRSIIPKSKLAYYNSIDLGIFLCAVEIVLAHHKKVFTREVYIDKDCNQELIPIAKYRIS